MKQTTIALNCPKGGVGKSTIAKELALGFAHCEIEGQIPKVCLIDGNLSFGDINALLRLNPTRTIVDWVNALKDTEQVIDINHQFEWNEIQSYFLQYNNSLYVLSAPTDTLDALNIDYSIMKLIIRNIKQFFDIVIIDTGNNTHDYTIACMEEAQDVLEILTDEDTTINAVLNVLQTFKRIDFSTNKLKFVINRYYTDKRYQAYSKKDIESVVGEVFATLSFDERVPKYNSAGVPIILGEKCDLQQDLCKLCKKLVPTFDVKNLKKGTSTT